MSRLAPILILCLVAGCGSGDSGPARTNLLLIVVDTLRADHLGAYGYSRPTSPAIDQLFRSSVVFEDAHATSSWTLPSLASLLTSTYSSTHGCWQFTNSLDPSFTTLPETLAADGYHTAAIVSHVFLGKRYGLHQGFVEYDESLVHARLDESHKAISSPELTRRAIEFLDGRPADGDAPWFLMVHYFDPHHFYQDHGDAAPAFGTRPMDRYDSEIAFTDAHIGRLLQHLEQSGQAQQTVVTFVADHGEEFRDHGRIFHGKTLFREVERIPLAIRAPGIEPGRVTMPIGAVDVMPTLLELLDVADPAVPMAGRSLVRLMRGEPFDRPGLLLESRLDQRGDAELEGYVTDRWKLILEYARTDGEGPRPEPMTVFLYDRQADPLERSDRSEQMPEVVARLRQRLEQAIAGATAVARAYSEAGELSLSEAELKRLRELGYVDPEPPPDPSAGDGKR